MASDVNQQYAIDGIGGLPCQRYIDAKDTQSSSYLHFGGWIEGYFTASNKFLESTYDISPWQSTETLASIIYTECSRNPKISFAIVVDKLTQQLKQFSSEVRSRQVTVRHGNYSMKLSHEVLVEMQNKLRDLGLLRPPLSGKYDNSTAEALQAYQELKKLPLTALPDQYTLWNLLLPE